MEEFARHRVRYIHADMDRIDAMNRYNFCQYINGFASVAIAKLGKDYNPFKSVNFVVYDFFKGMTINDFMNRLIEISAGDFTNLCDEWHPAIRILKNTTNVIIEYFKKIVPEVMLNVNQNGDQMGEAVPMIADVL